MEVKKIYFDMDGVLADFDRGVKELCGLPPRNQEIDDPVADDKMWNAIRNTDHFYYRLEFMPGAERMFRLLDEQHKGHCEILTGIPKKKRGIVTAGDDKIRWVREKLSEDIPIHVVYKEEKKNYCTGKDCILIDDYSRNIREWEENGGTGIQFTSADEVIEVLRMKGILEISDDYEGEISELEKLVEDGNTDAMVDLGNIYEAREEFEEAYKWYLEAALAGNEKGMFNVANMYFWGWHVPQDYKKAYDYFVKLNELGVGGTNYYLGLYAENGYVEPVDYEKAMHYYENGIEEGDLYCPVNMGRMYCLGLGMEVDYEKGFEFYYEGYLMGDPLACANLGYCYEVGQGVDADLEKAVMYYEEGAEQGEEHCIEALERIG